MFKRLFFKGNPNEFVIKFVNGKMKKSGPGRIFFVGPRTVIAKVSVSDQSVPFIFTELTRDDQEIMVKGDLQVKPKP